MSKVAIKTATLKRALKSYGKDIVIKLGATNTVVPFNEETKGLLEFLNEKIPLTEAQKNKIGGFLFADEALAKAEVSSVNEFYNKLSIVNTQVEPVLEIKINSKWYPLLASIQKWKGPLGWSCRLTVRGNLGPMEYSKEYMLGEWAFQDKAGLPTSQSLNSVLTKMDIRVASKESIARSKELSKKILELWSKAGKVYNAAGTGLLLGYFGWYDINIAHRDSPVNVVIEPTLENEYHDHDYHAGESWQLPFVRVFSLRHKSYIFAEIEELTEHVYHRDGKDKIVLPEKMRGALESIFNANGNEIFGDLFHGRHGGIVVLANGSSGVGKTLTAEVFAEYQERPLYSMEISEIGTSVEKVERSLQAIFARARKWNAVLLFDEADIFLSKRAPDDLERSAIVGIFLRLLDYYEGTFFLTTNRGEEIDDAFKSRVTLYLNYPELTNETRHSIWVNMLKSANINIKVDPDVWFQIVETPLNGRQIRNQVRLLKLMYPDGNLTATDILNSLEFTAR